MWKSLALCLALSALLSITTAKPLRKSSSRWWDNSILYQVYPRSFKDSNGDGVGDLNGITSKLEHIAEIADAFWLSPIFSSPQRDFGYDISNYTAIHPEYGTLEDFDRLVAKAKRLGLRILLDFVPNHTSDEHEWFKKSIERVPPYDDYYIWRDAKTGPDGTKLPPNNWLSFFTNSAWEWNEDREQYYYHNYAASQPDLNYRNPKLREEMQNVLKFWLDRGIDGYRVDAIAHLIEDKELRDEPRSNQDVPPNDYNYLEHIYTRDLNETYDVVSSWRKFFDEYSKVNGVDKKVLLMEVGSKLNYTLKYYDIDVDPFNFGFVHHLNNDSTALDVGTNIENWIQNMPRGKVANWIVGNHDVHRVASRFGYDNKRADQLSMLSIVLPGVTIIYNGDEIGMVNRFFSYKETVDPAGCNAGPERYQLKSRDPERTPYQWDDTVSAGFSTNLKTWLPVHDNYKTLNLAAQKKVEISHFKVFKALSKLKKLPVLTKGYYKALLVNDNVLSVVRYYPGQEPVALFINFSEHDEIVNGRWTINTPEELTVAVASVKSGLKTGDSMKAKKLLIPGSATVIFSSRELVSNLFSTV